MNYELYYIYDKVADQFSPPFMASNEAVAMRQFQMQIPQEYKDDFELRKVAEINLKTGEIVLV